MVTKDLNISNLDKGDNIIFKDDNIMYFLESTKNNKKNEKINNTDIDLGDCEVKLKKKYDIPREKSLYILKKEITIEGMKIPKFDYGVYYPLYNSTLVLLNLSICLYTKIVISYPMKLDEEKIDKYDLNSDYYNDICYTTTETGTDIILNDRRDDFLTYNLTIYEAECDLISYNDILEKTTCSCEVKIKIGSFSEIKFDKLILKRRFSNIYSISNFNVMKCSHLVFNKNIIYKNIGFYLITASLYLVLVPLLFFILKNTIN